MVLVRQRFICIETKGISRGDIIIIDGDSYRSFHPNYLTLATEEVWLKDSVDYTKEIFCRTDG